MISVPLRLEGQYIRCAYPCSVECSNQLAPLELCPNVVLHRLREALFDYSPVVQYPTGERTSQNSTHIQYFDALKWSQALLIP